jgi:hypothetical protein
MSSPTNDEYTKDRGMVASLRLLRKELLELCGELLDRCDEQLDRWPGAFSDHRHGAYVRLVEYAKLMDLNATRCSCDLPKETLDSIYQGWFSNVLELILVLQEGTIKQQQDTIKQQEDQLKQQADQLTEQAEWIKQYNAKELNVNQLTTQLADLSIQMIGIQPDLLQLSDLYHEQQSKSSALETEMQRKDIQLAEQEDNLKQLLAALEASQSKQGLASAISSYFK